MLKLRVTILKDIALILKRDLEDFQINQNNYFNSATRFVMKSYDMLKVA